MSKDGPLEGRGVGGEGRGADGSRHAGREKGKARHECRRLMGGRHSRPYNCIERGDDL